MDIRIRPMKVEDREAVLGMMEVFYHSPAVYTNGSMEIFERDFENCVGNCPFLDGLIVESEGEILGYSMVAKSFSTEFGKTCIWIEDLYLREAARGLGLGRRVLDVIIARYPNAIFRLEVEEDNQRALKLYEKFGFTVLPYMEMKFDPQA